MSENVHWPTPTPAAPTPPPATETTEYFAVSTSKFVVMSLFTWGFYELYWAYKQWVVIKRKTGEEIWPFWRAFFAGLWGYSLMKRIKGEAETRGIPVDWSWGWLGFAYMILLGTWRLPDPWWLISLLSFLPLLPALQTIERINNPPPHMRNAGYSRANIIGILVGAVMAFLVGVGMAVE